MKNTTIATIILLAGIGGASFLLDDNSEPKKLPIRNDDPQVERSYAEYGDKDCADFSSQDEAQEFFEDQGGPATDFHNLDKDGDGIACETLK